MQSDSFFEQVRVCIKISKEPSGDLKFPDTQNLEVLIMAILEHFLSDTLLVNTITIPHSCRVGTCKNLNNFRQERGYSRIFLRVQFFGGITP